ncbi:MAG: M13 family metallopeptidase [Xanthomonadaceae bacterium]|nr:M13 family metallopeptidase [Xanthomonadaceae bacterium]
MSKPHALRPAALALCLVAAIAAPHADAAKKRKPAKPAPKPVAALSACVDLYGAVNADWLKDNPVPANGSTSALGELAARARDQQRALLEAAAKSPQGQVQKLLGDFWASGMDEAAVERDGAAPIAPLLARIDAIKKPQEVAPAIAALHQVGIPVAFNFTADIDLKNLDTYMGYFAQGGLGLPDASFYTRNDADARNLLGRYNGYVQKIMVLTGTSPANAAADATFVIDLETRIARASKARADLVRLRTNYNPIPTKDFQKKYRNLQLQAFLQAQGVTAEQVSMADPALFAQLDKMITSLKPAQWKAYLRFQVGNAMAPYLSKNWRDADHAFRGQLLRGEMDQAPRPQQVLDAINAAAGSMMAQAYTERYLSQDAADRGATISRHMREALEASIASNTWMDDATRAEAVAKLQKLKIEIGKPRSNLDFSIQPMGRGSFGSNILIASTWHHREEMKRIGRPNADRRWDVLPQHPALGYDLPHNRLFITAAVLQAPVLDMKQPLAAQYGSFGALVGHELSRVVDAKGRYVDATGNLRDWWSPASASAWQGRIAPLQGVYGRFTYPGKADLKIDGARTLGENAADLAGLELAWTAYARQEPQANDSAQQQFFRGWARLWAQQLSADAGTTHAQSSPYAPGQWRANAPAMQLPAFTKAHACKAGTPLFVADGERVSIWR